MAWGDAGTRYDLKSTTKSFGSIALGLAVRDGKLRLEDKARRHHPALGVPPEENAQTGWLDEITILHLASQTAGFESRAATRDCCSGRARSGTTAIPGRTGYRVSRWLTGGTWTSGCSSAFSRRWASGAAT